MKSVFEIYYQIIKTYKVGFLWWKADKQEYVKCLGSPESFRCRIIYAENFDEAVEKYKKQYNADSHSIIKFHKEEFGRDIVSVEYNGYQRDDMSIMGVARHLSADEFIEFCKDRNFPACNIKALLE